MKALLLLVISFAGLIFPVGSRVGLIPQIDMRAVEIAAPRDDESVPAAPKKAARTSLKGEPKVEGTRGFLVLNDQRANERDMVRFYNEDGSLWYEFSFFYDDSDGRFDYPNDNFHPYAFHPDYFLLSLKYAGEDDKRYKVIVNEETGLRKYVLKSDDALKLESWKDQIENAFSLTFDHARNPIRDSPCGKPKMGDFFKADKFEVVGFEGEWVQVRWSIDKKTDSGWVRWKRGEKLLIEIQNLC